MCERSRFLQVISLLSLVDLVFQFLAFVLRRLNFPVRHPLRIVSMLTLERLRAVLCSLFRRGRVHGVLILFVGLLRGT